MNTARDQIKLLSKLVHEDYMHMNNQHQREAVELLKELMNGLDESVKLQAHYGKLLNMHDGGERMTFENTEAWLARLRELAEEHPYTEPDIDPRFLKTEFVVAATSTEQQMLWHRHHYTASTPWKQESKGTSIQVGELAGFPVNVSIFWATIDGLYVLFYEPISQVVDHKMVESWFDKNCNPRWDNGSRGARVNAENFNHVLHAASAKKEQAEA